MILPHCQRQGATLNHQSKRANPQAIGIWLRRLGKDNQRIKALQKVNKTVLKTMAYLLSGKLDLNRVNGFLPTCF